MAKKAPSSDSQDKLRQSMLDQMRRTFGFKNTDEKDFLHFADEHISISDVISTGHPHLDQLLTPEYYARNERGGIPYGFVVEFFGPNAGGKTSLCLKLAATVTKSDMALWIDAEGSFVTDWADAHGVNRSNLMLLSRPGMTGEEYIENLEEAASSGMFKLVVIDSMDALVPKVLLESDLEDAARVGAKAQLMSRSLPRIINAAKKGNCAVIFINQIRNKIGVMWGSPETTPGGEALRFYASLRLRMQQVTGKNDRAIMLDGEEIGIRSEVLIRKNRFGPPHKSTIIPIYYRSDLKPHPLDVIIDSAIGAKVITVRAKHNKDETSTQFLTFSPTDDKGKALPGYENLVKVEGIDTFKGLVDLHHIKKIVESCLASKVLFDPDIDEYIRRLEEDPTSGIQPVLEQI